MEFSTPSTQRSSSSEGLLFQPGSVRPPLADAADDFARHLAENSKQMSERRDDRPVDRREQRSAAAERTERLKDEPSTRKTAREERDEEKTKSADRSEAGAPKAGSGETVIQDAEAAEESASLEHDAATPDETAETSEDSDSKEAEKESAETAPEDGTDLPLAATQAIADASMTQTAGKNGIDMGSATKQAGDAAQQHAAGKSADIRTPEQTPGTATPDGDEMKASAGNEEVQAKKQSTARNAAQLPAQAQTPAGTAADELAAAGIEEQQINSPKAEKGLGQEAAERLAEKKSGDKQASAQPSIATAPNTQQPGHNASAAPQPAQPGAASTIATAPAANGDIAISSVQQAASGGNPATIRVGTLPGQTQPTQLPANTIALQMARNLQKGTNRFDIRLDPPELGRIDVRMEVRKDGHVVAHMTVDRPETLDLLQRDARALQQALNNAGLQADNDSLNFSLRDQSEESGSRDFANGGGGSGAPGDEIDGETPPAPIYNVNLAANGGVDIRV